MRLLEVLITIMFYMFLPFYFVERVVHKKSYGWKEKFGEVGTIYSKEDKVIHIHCCSVGESLAIENLLKEIRNNFPNNKIVVTTFTYAGQNIAQKKFKDLADLVTYFPFDMPISVNKFLDKINPALSIIVETEIWPYYAYSCQKRNIPLFIINARISDKSYGQYKFMKPFFSRILKNYRAIYAQSFEDMEKFISIGMNKNSVDMMGNLKFDIEPKDVNIDIGQNGYRILLAGSTHKPENEIILSCFNKLKKEFKDLKLLIAPRHMERVEDIKDLAHKNGISYGLRSKNDKFNDEIDMIILDTLGELGKMYSICDLAFIGGSFNNTGGHNPLEAAIFNKPVVSGPAIFNFKDIYEILTKSEAGKVVKTSEEYYKYVAKLLSDKEFYNKTVEASKKVFDDRRGAIDFVINKIKENL